MAAPDLLYRDALVAVVPPAVRAAERRAARLSARAAVEGSPEEEAAETSDEEAAEDDGRVAIAISSEQGVERYDWMTGERYTEVLDHAPSSVDLTRAKAGGLAFLLSHDRYDQYGVIEDVTVDADRKLRGFVRFSRGAKAQEIRQDMLDGIRTHISVGYRVGDAYDQTVDAATKQITRRYLDWGPYEASTVPIPADVTVGVGRSAPPGTVPGAPPAAPTPAPASEARSVRMADQANGATATPTASREHFINEIAEAAGLSAGQARTWRESDKTIKQISDEAFKLVGEREGHGAAPAPVNVQLTEREQRSYSLVRALNLLVEGKPRGGFEFEVSDDIAKQLGRSTNGLYMPTALSAQNPAAAPNAAAQRSLLSVGQAGKGAEAKFVEYAGFIDLLKARMVTTAMGATYLSGLVGDLAFVGQNGRVVLTWGTETQNAPLSSPGFTLRTMSPKIAQAATTVTRQLLRQSVFDIENLLRNDIATVHALGIDAAALWGTGTGSQPLGVFRTPGINAVVGGPNGAYPDYPTLVALQSQIALDNALAGSLGYVANPLSAARLMVTQEFVGGTVGAVWQGNILDGQVAGFRAMSSTQMPSGQTKGTSSDVAPIGFGNFSDLLIGEWGAMELLVDPYTLGPAVVKLASIQMVDVFVRRFDSFALFGDARA